MKTICIHSEKAGFHKKWAEFIALYGYHPLRFNLLSNSTDTSILECSAVMWHLSMLPDKLIAAHIILNSLEHNCSKPVFPNWKTRWHFENKIAQYNLLRLFGIPTPNTEVFWNKNEALSFIKTASYPLVFKLATGAGSINIEKIHNSYHAKQKVNSAFSASGIFSEPGYYPVRRRHGTDKVRNSIGNLLIRIYSGMKYVLLGKYPPLPRDLWMPEKNYILFQEFLSDNEYDTRVTVIGDRAYAFRRFNRSNDFRASGSGRIDHDPNYIDMHAVKLAFKISEVCGFQSMAYDYLYDTNGQLCVSEMCFGYNNIAVHDCPGHWDSDLNWHEGNMWPEEAHVIDFINSIEGKDRLHNSL